MAQTFIFNGKEQQIWTQTQLEQLGKTALKQRAMDLRDLAGADVNLPTMPRHPELLVPWIMQVQSAMSGAGGDMPVSRGGAPASRGESQQEPPQRGYQKQSAPQYEDDRCSNQGSEYTEAMSNFQAAKMQRMAAQQNARSSNIFGGA